jgi:ATP-dependent DNA helicase RecQ
VPDRDAGSPSATAERCASCVELRGPHEAFCPACGLRADEPGAPPPLGEAAEFAAVDEVAPPAELTRSRPPREAGQAVQAPLFAAPAAPPDRSELPATLEAYREQLRTTFGYPDFRDGQALVLERLAARDVLAVMPTGSGKSLCYVLPALEVGRTLVVSPLIALMQDQVEALQAAGVSATFINSNLSRSEQNRRYNDFVEGRIALLYVAPERFANRGFTAGLLRAGVNLLAIDEAHCISEWGHNFRPDYLQLGAVREWLGEPRTLALTATANPQVRRDIVQRLGLSGRIDEVTTTIDRPNLTFNVVAIPGPDARREWIVEYVRERAEQSGIVYARTRRSVEELAAELRRAGLSAEPYHAGLPKEQRTATQRRFMLGGTAVIVATNAFGMGIDKPDIRFVVHFNLPGRIEAYYQEAGRAGRDGDPAECTLLYARRDRVAQQHFIDRAHPDDDDVREAWLRLLASAGADGTILDGGGGGDPEQFAMALSALRASGLVEPVELRLRSTDPTAPIDTSNIARHRAHEDARLSEMTEYAETNDCRRAVILRYFGEEAPERCDRCDACENGGASEYPDELYESIVELRAEIARRGGREPSRVFENRTARELASQRPRDEAELREVWGIGGTRAEWFGADLLRLIADWEQRHPDAPARTMPEPAARARRSAAADPGPEVSTDDPLYEALRTWRLERARAEQVPAYTLFSDRTLRELVARRPRGTAELLQVWGFGDERVRRFGEDVIAVIRGR